MDIDKSSHSEVESYVSCERKHYYSYGLKIQGKLLSDSLAKGILGHAVLGAYYSALQKGMSHQEAMEVAAPILWTEGAKLDCFDYITLCTDLSVLLNDYWNHYKDEYIEVLEVEILHDLQLIEDFTMPVRLDLLCRLPGYGVTLMDHKFSWNFYDVDKIDLSPQLSKYYAALMSRGIKVDTVMYNELRTQQTKVNKEFTDQKFRRTPIVVTPQKVVRIMSEQIRAARRISQLKKMPLVEWEKVILRNTNACNMCSFTTICDADLTGGDSDLVRQAYYEEKSYR